jgi:hypothetical protein
VTINGVIDLRGHGEVSKFTHGPLGAVGVRVAHIPIIDETRPPPDGWEDAREKPLDDLYLLMLEDPTEEEVRKILFAIGTIGLLYVFLNAVANSGLSPSLKASRTYRNAEFMYVAMGFREVAVVRKYTRHAP